MVSTDGGDDGRFTNRPYTIGGMVVKEQGAASLRPYTIPPYKNLCNLCVHSGYLSFPLRAQEHFDT